MRTLGEGIFRRKGTKIQSIYIFFFVVTFLFLSCNREYNNPTETDTDLSNQPQIIKVEKSTDLFVSLYLNYAFSSSAEIILERKTSVAFEEIPFVRQSSSVLLDTNFTRESDYNFVYRVKVQKNVNGITYSTAYSTARSFFYLSTTLNAPENVSLQTLELQGVKILWEDKSGKEDGYKVEKNSGNGFTEIATLSANSTSYMDTISGTPTPPLNLTYRVKAYNAALASSWKEISTAYSGIGSPTNLIIIDSSFWKFTIQWQRNSSIATGYVVERKRDVGNYVTLANVGATISSYVDTLKDSGSYSYRVKAKKDNLYSAYSNEVVYSLTEVLPTQGLVAYYPFNGNANDESGNGNGGTVNGATLTTDRFGRNNRAYVFDGVNDTINFGNVVYTKNIPFSVSFWYNATTNYQGNLVTKYIGSSYNGFNVALDWRHSGALVTYYLRSRSNYVAIANQSDGLGADGPYPAANKWNHVVVIVSSMSMDMYLNGSKIVSANWVGIPGSTTENTDLTLGQLYQGKLDDLLFYNRVLTEQEVQELFHEGGWY